MVVEQGEEVDGSRTGSAGQECGGAGMGGGEVGQDGQRRHGETLDLVKLRLRSAEESGIRGGDAGTSRDAPGEEGQKGIT